MTALEGKNDLNRLRLLFLSVLLGFCLVPVQAADASGGVVKLYVSSEGNDRFSGSEQFPFATLEKALKTVRLLDERTVIYLREGTYEGGILLDEEDDRVTVRSYPGERVVVQAKAGKPALAMQDCGTVAVLGIVFSGGSGAVVERCTNAFIADCEFSGMLQGMVVDGNARVENNVIQETRGAGLTVKSGSSETLEMGDCTIVNNRISHFSQDGLGEPGVLLKGNGIVFSHNDISDGDSCAIEITGNNHLVQYNHISRIDAPGAICTQGDVTARGSEIRDNMVQDCTGSGILLGEFSSGVLVFGNVFYQLNQAVKMMGGRNNIFLNNLSVDCSASLSLETVDFPYAKRKEMQGQLDRISGQEEIWLQEYPELETLMEDQPGIPKYNQVSGNLVFQTPASQLDAQVVQYGQVEADTVLSDASVFQDYANGDFTLKDGAFPCFQMGSRKEATQRLLERSVVLMLHSWCAVNHGNHTAIDPMNHKVMPVEQSGRTLVPIRFIAESMGAQVDWDAENKLVTIRNEELVVTLTIGSRVMTVNGEAREIDTAAVQSNDRTLVPLRAVAETFHFEVNWDPSGLIVISEEPVTLDDELVKQAVLRQVSLVI